MASIRLEDNVSIPANITDVEAFRRWAHSDDFPEHGRFSFLRDELWVDLTMEQAFTHNRVKTRINGVLDELVVSGSLGYYFSDRMLLSHPDAELSTEPDGMFVSYDAIRTGRVQLLEGAEGGYVELLGAPDMVLEVVSKKSVVKDTKVLRQLYWEAGVPEYWLIDARGETPLFDLLRRQARGYALARRQGGWARSAVFGRAFQLTQQADPLGHPQFDLAVCA
jgi:Uma2 family endonuclease